MHLNAKTVEPERVFRNRKPHPFLPSGMPSGEHVDYSARLHRVGPLSSLCQSSVPGPCLSFPNIDAPLPNVDGHFAILPVSKDRL